MKCEKCEFYQPSLSGVDEGFYTACKERNLTLQVISPLTNEEKQEVMDELKKNCRGFQKI